ncbi:MAG: CARDB domain-containing protein, partial [Methanobacteriota archaeon]
SLEVVGESGAVALVPFELVVVPHRAVAFEGAAADAAPRQRRGTEAIHELVLANAGNLPLSLELSLDAPAGVRAALSRRTADVLPGARVPLSVSVAADADVPAGRLEVAVVARDDASGYSARLPVRVEIFESDLVLLRVVQEPRFAVAVGTPVTFSAEVENRGGSSADDVAIGLFVDDHLVAYLPLGTLAPGTTVATNLSWNATEGARFAWVVVDPYEALGEVREDNNAYGLELEVEGPGGITDALSGAREVPFPVFWVWIAAGVAAVALRGRRPPPTTGRDRKR